MTTQAENTYTLNLTEEEYTLLLRVLEEAQKALSVESRRTDALTYREYIHHQESVMQHLTEKVRQLRP